MRKWLLLMLCVLLLLTACSKERSCGDVSPAVSSEESVSIEDTSEDLPSAEDRSIEDTSEALSSVEDRSDVLSETPPESSAQAAQGSSSACAASNDSAVSAPLSSLTAPSSQTTTQPAESISSAVSSASLTLPSSQPVSSAPASSIRVSMTITGLNGEVIAAVNDFEVAEGSTVFTVLRDYACLTGLRMEYSGGTKSAYVSGIDGLYEFDHGIRSGWLYRVNGDFEPASVSCGSYPVYDGDRIEWLYTTDGGADVGAPRF